MKRLHVLVVCLGLVLMFGLNNAFAGGAVKLGIDFEGDHDVSYDGSTASFDAKSGVSFSGELLAPMNPYVDFGGGITFQFPRELDGWEDEFNFIPIYGLIRVKSPSGDIAPYFTGQIGYNFLLANSAYKTWYGVEGDVDGGLYYGLGGGIIIHDRFVVELLYTVNNGEITFPDATFDVEYTKFTLNLGFNF